MSEKLANCPFCGGEPKLFGSTRIRVAYVQCSQCESESGTRDDEAEAIEAWNRRHQDQDTASTFERWVK